MRNYKKDLQFLLGIRLQISYQLQNAESDTMMATYTRNIFFVPIKKERGERSSTRAATLLSQPLPGSQAARLPGLCFCGLQHYLFTVYKVYET
jgi:hypothetical protein